MRYSLRALLLGVVLSSGWGLCCVQAEPLRLVADAWPPFTDASMDKGGLATELVTTALTRAGYASKFEQAPWARALMGVSEGRYDVLINAWFSEGRARFGEFSSGYLLNRVLLIKRKGDSISPGIDTEGLRPYPIAVVRGYAYASGFDADEQLQKVPVRDFSTAIRMLTAGRVRLTLDDEMVARYYLQREPAAVRDSIEFIPQPLSENRLRILVSLKHPDHNKIVEAFDREIAAMRADGSYARLMRRYGM